MNLHNKELFIKERMESPAMDKSWFKVAMGALLAMLSATVAAAPMLSNITYIAQGDAVTAVRLELSEPVSKPTSFTIDNPARIAIDLPGVHLASDKKMLRIDTGLVRDVRSVEAGGKTRVVVDMIRLVPYSLHSDGSSLILAFNETAGVVSSASATAKGAKGQPVAKMLKSVDFRRGVDGQGQLQITLSDPMSAVDIDERMGRIYLKFLNNRVPERLERRLDVIDFATPVTTIDTVNSAEGAAVTIATHGEYQYLAYQTGDTYTVEVRPITKAEAEAKKPKYSGEKLSLNFQNIEVRAVLQLLADFTGLNIVASDSVQGNITLRLKNVPWDQAMDIVLKTKGLGMRRNGDVIMVAPNAELASMEKQELESKKQIQEVAPLRTRFYTVNYAKADDISKLLKGEKNSILSSRGSVSVDKRTNTLMVLETEDKQAEVAALVKKLDIPIRQVLIESRIVIANNNYSRQLGARAGFTAITANPPRSGNGAIVTSGTVLSTAYSTNEVKAGMPSDPTSIDSNVTNRLNVNLPASSSAPRIALGILGKDYLVDLELSALQTEGKGEVLSNPRVLTANQKEAKIESGVEIPYSTASANGTNIQFKKAVLSLAVTPQITPDDRIIMDLNVTKDSVGQYVGTIPSINKREITTQVLVGNGETVVLGGIFEQNQADGESKVPLLGDIPILGMLFRQKTHTQDQTELLIFVSPKIVKESLQAGLN